jgi:glycine/D-amino acid oxidase-like deaminating enzyme
VALFLLPGGPKDRTIPIAAVAPRAERSEDHALTTQNTRGSSDVRGDPRIPPSAGRSWWLREALAADPGERCPPLDGDHEADIVVLGGGYTGMWTAHELVRRDPGLDVVLLEQDICGGGASGRNGGFVNGFWNGIEEISRLFPVDRALELLRAADRSVQEIGEFCDRHGVDAWYTRGGDLGIATSPSQRGRWSGTLAAARRLGVADQFEEMSAADVARRCRSPAFDGGMLTRNAATVHPARLARGLRRVLLEQGVRIFEGSPLRRFTSGPPAIAETPGGRVRAASAILALNAGMKHWPQFLRHVAARGSYMVITSPAPERLAEIGWTGGESIWNFRSAVNYFRTTPDGRVAFGTGGMQPGFARSIGPRFAYDEGFVRRVAEHLWRLLPSFADVPLEAAWGGAVDVSGSHLPFYGTLPSGNVHYGAGYTGNGVGPSRLGGAILASLAVGGGAEFARLPVVELRSKRFPPEPLRSAGVLLANTAIMRKDEAEDAGARAGPIVEFVARLPRRLGYNLGP